MTKESLREEWVTLAGEIIDQEEREARPNRRGPAAVEPSSQSSSSQKRQSKDKAPWRQDKTKQISK
jgi:hypothetical protein